MWRQGLLFRRIFQKNWKGRYNIMKIIAAVDKNWAIGYQNQLLVQIPDDMRHFKNMTGSHVVFMGRKTLMSFPDSRPLPDRTNIVLTSDRNFHAGQAVIVHSVEEALEEFRHYNSDEIYIIGGSSVYEQFLPYVQEAFITYIQHEYQADAYFPRIDKAPDWQLAQESGEQSYFGVKFCFRRYVKSEMTKTPAEY